jgi:hypothetical protein
MRVLPSVGMPPLSNHTSNPLFVPPSVTPIPGSTPENTSLQTEPAPARNYTPLPAVQNRTPASIAIPFRTPRDIQTAGRQVSVSRSGFLWKPVSENDGKLVILLPQSLTGKIRSASIHSSLPPRSENMIENGRFSGDTHNENRAHFRFSKPGSSYPDNTYVVAQLNDGTYTSFQIGSSGARNN